MEASSSFSLTRNQWVRYFIALFVLIVLVESFIRSNEKSVFSLQDGQLIKLQMFALRDTTEILFFGTSRTQDSINPSLIAEHLGAANPRWRNAKAFNGAAAGGSLSRLAYSVDMAVKKPGLKLLGIEMSAAQLSDGPWTPVASKEEAVSADLETTLQQGLAKYSYLIKYRKALRLERAIKLIFLIFPNLDDGTKWFGQVGGTFKKTMINASDSQPWNLGEIVPLPANMDNHHSILPNSERYFSVFSQVADAARQHGVQIFLYVPPVRGQPALKECDADHVRTYQAIALKIQAPLLFHSCSESSPSEYFSDDSHLNVRGKSIWSKQVADDLIQLHL